MHIHTSDQEKLSLGFGNYTCNWGTHMCALYSTDAERDEFLFDYLHQGDIDGDTVYYIHSTPTADEFKSEYSRRFLPESAHINDADRFRLVNSKEFYAPDGRFDPLRMDPTLLSVRSEAQQPGNRVRGLAEMDWALLDLPGCELLLPYEARSNAIYSNASLVLTCIYDLRKFSGEIIMGVLRSHRFTIFNGVIVENPYFNPDQVVAEYGLRWPPLV
jgi:hypothetical protein